MSRFEILIRERGKPVLTAKAEQIEICKEKFENRFNEKYGGGINVNQNKTQ
ncbi:hypothetical protein [Methanochimaera problematica]|uniref:hypothetical protein n=1 Tax=Methanochimaera problematica TaxID=2609417 RepID=UPI002938ECC1|nr:hypothetical protein [Methanoplanus sp. FWC-SCC4]